MLPFVTTLSGICFEYVQLLLTFCGDFAIGIIWTETDPIMPYLANSVCVFTSTGGSWSFFQDASDPFKLKKKKNLLVRRDQKQMSVHYN